MQTNPRPSHKAGRYAMLDLRHTGIPSIQAVRKKMEKKTRVGLYWTNSFQLTTVVNRPLHSTTGLPEGKAHRPWSISTWATQTDLLIAWCQTCVCQNGLATQARLCGYTKSINLNPEFRDNFPSAESACSIRPVCSYRLMFDGQNVQRIEKTSSLKAYWHGNMLS